MATRRAFVTGTIALAAFPARAGKAQPPPKTANIRWPGPGHELHGYMAIPGRAHGPQPAVLVVHDAGGADAFARGLADALALAGFVACVPNAIATLDEAVATVRWLGTNAYATGKVAAVGLGWGGALVERIADTPGSLLSCGIAFGGDRSDVADSVPILRLAALTADDPAGYAAAWQQAIAFLGANLHPPHKH